MPDIQPLRLGVTDVVSLTVPEIYAILTHLAGHENPEVAEAVVDVTRQVLSRTRGDKT